MKMATATKTISVKNLKGKKFKEKFYDEPFEVMGSDGDLYDPRAYFKDYDNSNEYDIGDIF